MKKSVLGLALMLGFTGAFAKTFMPDQRVFIGVYSDNIEDDVFAEGKVIEDLGKEVKFQVTRVSGHRQHAFKGCALPWIPDPSDEHPLPASEIYDRVKDKGAVVILPESHVLHWEHGRQVYYDRDWLKDIYLRWDADSMGLSHDRIDVAMPVAEKLKMNGFIEFLRLAKPHMKATRNDYAFMEPEAMWAKNMMPVLDELERLFKAYPKLADTAFNGNLYMDGDLGLVGGYFLSKGVKRVALDIEYAIDETNDEALAKKVDERFQGLRVHLGKVMRGLN